MHAFCRACGIGCCCPYPLCDSDNRGGGGGSDLFRPVHADVVGDLAITADDDSELTAADYSYADGVLTIKSSKPMTISMAPGKEGYKTPDNRIVIAANANITVSGISIGPCSPAINVSGATLNLTLVGDNALHSNNDYSALQLTNGGSVVIGGSGTLNAWGGHASGIGGGRSGYGATNGGNITINSGTVTSGVYLAGSGIGGGLNTRVGNITINGGIVQATGAQGAGIGGGAGNTPAAAGTGNITINGGTVIANGGYYCGAAIGGGGEQGWFNLVSGGSTGTITINGGTVVASGTGNGQDIGTGDNAEAVTGIITINGGSVLPKNGRVSGGGYAGAKNGANTPVAMTTLTVGNPAVPGGIAALEGSIAGVSCTTGISPTGTPYGINDVETDAEGKIYFWLPAAAAAQTIDLETTENYYSGTRAANTTAATLICDPRIKGVSPAGTGAGTSGSVIVSFSGAMDTTLKDTVTLTPADGAPVTLDADEGVWDATALAAPTYTIPYTGLAFATHYTVGLSGFVTGATGLTLPAGSTLAADDTHSFTTGTFTAFADPAELDFGIEEPGYAEAPAAREVIITATGTDALTGLVAQITGADASAFEVSSALSSTDIAVDGMATVSVRPAADLVARGTPYEAVLSITSDNGLSLDVPLVFSVLAYRAEADPVSWDFGTATTGYGTPPAEQTFTIVDTGTEALTGVVAAIVKADTLDPDVFEITEALAPTDIAHPSGMATVSVRPVTDVPARHEPYTATLAITNADGLSLDVPLSFTVASYTATSTPASHDFGTSPVGYGTPPAEQSFTIANTGTAELTGVSAAIVKADVSDPDVFAITEALSPEDISYPSGTATVVVRPATAVPARHEPYTATLAITNADGLVLDVPLSFTVSSYTAASTPAEKDFGTVPAGYGTPPAAQVLTITNTGTAALSGLTAQVTGSDAAAFGITEALSSASVAYQSSATVSVRPVTGMAARPAPYVATLRIGGDNDLVLDVPLSFTVASYTATATPAFHDFGTSPVGYGTPPVAQSFTITNTGTAELTGVSAAIVKADTLDPDVFSITEAPTPEDIAYPSGTATVSVRPFTGVPARHEPYSATLAITNADGLSLDVPLSFTVSSHTAMSSPAEKDFGTVPAGYDTPPVAQAFSITNTGTVALTNLSAQITGTDASAFEVSTALSSDTLGWPLGSASVSVRPVTDMAARPAPYVATLRIGGDNDLVLDVPLSFTVASYTATASPTSHDFGTSPLDYTQPPAEQSFTITNTGTAELTGVSATIVKTDTLDPDVFAITEALSPEDISYPSGTATVVVRPVTAVPARPAPYSATLAITNAEGLVLDVPLSFTVSSYLATASPASHDFGTVPVGYSTPPTEQTFSITNIGTVALTNLSAQIVGTDASAFEVSTALSSDALVWPLGSAAVSARPVTGMAARHEPYVATLRIGGDNDLVVDVPLSFTVASYTATATPASHDFGTVPAGYSTPPAAQVLTITNTGTAALSGLTAQVTGSDAAAFGITEALSSASVGYQDSATVSVRPVTGLGERTAPYTATLRIGGDNGLVLDVPLSFTVISKPHDVLRHFGTPAGDTKAVALVEGNATAFVRLVLDGVSVNPTGYTVSPAEHGGCAIALVARYLSLLAPGTYAFYAEFSDGTAGPITLTVKTPPDPDPAPVPTPDTDDAGADDDGSDSAAATDSAGAADRSGTVIPATGDAAPSTVALLAALLLSAAALLDVRTRRRR